MSKEILTAKLPRISGSPQRNVVVYTACDEVLRSLTSLTGVQPVHETGRFVPAYTRRRAIHAVAPIGTHVRHRNSQAACLSRLADLDSSIRNPQAGIYGTLSTSKTRKGATTTVSQHPYLSTILNHPKFRTQYNSLMLDMLAVGGALDASEINVELLLIEAVLTEALVDDPNNQIENTPEAIQSYFDYLATWVVARSQNVRSQVTSNNLPSPRPDY